MGIVDAADVISKAHRRDVCVDEADEEAGCCHGCVWETRAGQTAGKRPQATDNRQCELIHEQEEGRCEGQKIQGKCGGQQLLLDIAGRSFPCTVPSAPSVVMPTESPLASHWRQLQADIVCE